MLLTYVFYRTPTVRNNEVCFPPSDNESCVYSVIHPANMRISVALRSYSCTSVPQDAEFYTHFPQKKGVSYSLGNTGHDFLSQWE
jgi:hypothetical protein